jgi:hypothetical protein
LILYSFIDQKSGLYFFADRSNRAIDIFDTATDKFVDRVGGFIGVVMKNGKPNNDTSGPDGVVLAGDEVWAGDGDSTIKIIDVATRKVVATLNTGGKTRLDETAYDPKDQVFIGVNNAEDPPFATVISTKPDRRIIGKVVFEKATDGAEQPQYNPNDGMFYMSIPELDKDAKKGAIAVIDPNTAKLVKMLQVDNCHPAGLAFGPNDNFVLGCGADGKDMPAVTTIMNAKTDQVVAVVAGVGAADMVDYKCQRGQGAEGERPHFRGRRAGYSAHSQARQSVHRRMHRFSWITEWKERADANNRPQGIELILPDWFYSAAADSPSGGRSASGRAMGGGRFWGPAALRSGRSFR